MSDIKVQGLVSNTNWGNLIQDMIKNQKTATIDPLNSKKAAYQAKLTAWQDFNSLLRSLGAYISSNKMATSAGYALFSTSLTTTYSGITPNNILSVSVSSANGPGTYNIEVMQLAETEKFSSAAFGSKTAAIGEGEWTGDIIVNGKKITVANTDSLIDVASKINNASADATATIVSVSATEHYLNIESNVQGEHVLEVQNGSSLDILADKLKLHSGTLPAYKQFAHAGSGGEHYSSVFANTATDIKTLLDLTSAEQGTITIQGQAISIDLSADSLSTIADKINAKVSGAASVETVRSSAGEATGYKLKLDSSIAYGDLTDDKNILETLGIVEGKRLNPLSTDSGKNAILKLDGRTIISGANTVSSAVSGITLNLKETNIGKPIKLSIAYDNAAVSGKVSALIASVNSVLANIKSQNTYTPPSAKSNSTSGTVAPLFGDLNLSIIQATIRKIAFTETAGNATYKTLSSIGITFNQDGTLNMDVTAFSNALTTNRTEVENVIKGFADALYEKATLYVDPLTGSLTGITEGISARMKDIDKNIKDLDAKYERKAEMLQQRYNMLEKLIAQSETTKNWLTLQTKALMQDKN